MKKRSIGVALFSLYFIATNLITLIYAIDSNYAASISAIYLFTNYGLMLLGGIFQVAGAILCIFLGVLLWMLREMARKVFIAVQALSVLGGVFLAIQTAVWGGGILTLLFTLIVFNLFPIVSIIFFMRPKVKEQFK